MKLKPVHKPMQFEPIMSYFFERGFASDLSIAGGAPGPWNRSYFIYRPLHESASDSSAVFGFLEIEATSSVFYS